MRNLIEPSRTCADSSSTSEPFGPGLPRVSMSMFTPVGYALIFMYRKPMKTKESAEAANAGRTTSISPKPLIVLFWKSLRIAD